MMVLTWHTRHACASYEFDIAVLLGTEETKARIAKAVDVFSN